MRITPLVHIQCVETISGLKMMLRYSKFVPVHYDNYSKLLVMGEDVSVSFEIFAPYCYERIKLFSKFYGAGFGTGCVEGTLLCLLRSVFQQKIVVASKFAEWEWINPKL